MASLSNFVVEMLTVKRKTGVSRGEKAETLSTLRGTPQHWPVYGYTCDRMATNCALPCLLRGRSLAESIACRSIMRFIDLRGEVDCAAFLCSQLRHVLL